MAAYRVILTEKADPSSSKIVVICSEGKGIARKVANFRYGEQFNITSIVRLGATPKNSQNF